MRRFLTALTPFAVAVAILGMSRGSVEGRQPATAGEFDQLIGTSWYSVNVFGQPGGYACIQVERLDGPEGPQLRVTEDVRVLISIAGQELETSKAQVTIYDSQLRPVRLEAEKNELGRVSHVEAWLEDGQMVVRTQMPEPGGAPEEIRRIDAPEDLTSDLLVPLHLLREGLSLGDEFSYHVYDADIGTIDLHTVTVERLEQIEDAEAFVLTAKSEKLGIEVLSWITPDGQMVRQSVPALMGLTLERVSEEEALATISPLEIRSEIAVSQRLPLASSLREVRLRVHRNVGAAADLIPESRRQSVTAEGDDAVVTIRRETPPAESLALPIADPEMAAYLAPTSHVQADHPRIIETAREIIGDETDAWGAAQKLSSWVRHNMHSVPSEPRPMSALECLEAMRGDCTEHAMLLAALGRAVGLPTRLCTGLAYVGGKFGYHAWNEVYVGRWVEMDPSWGQITADATHLLLYSSSLDEASYARASLATGRTLGAISLEVVGYVTADGRDVRLEEE